MISPIQVILTLLSCTVIYFIVREVYLIRKNSNPTIEKPNTRIEAKEYIILGVLAFTLLVICLAAIF